MLTGTAFTARGADGRALPAVQPKSGSVSGSPFSVGASAVATPALTGPAVMIITTQPIHVRFSEAGTDADANDMLVPANVLLTFPVKDRDKLSMIQDSAAATVYVEEVLLAGG